MTDQALPAPPPGRVPLDRRTLLASAAGLGGLASACGTTRAARRADAEGELSEIFSDLGDQSARWKPISAAEKLPRLARLAGCLGDAGVDALLIEPGATLRYLSGVGWGRSERLFALVALADGGCFWVVPAFEVPRAAKLIAEHGPPGPIVSWEEHEYAWEPLAAALRARAVERIAIEPEARAFVAQRLAEAFGPERVVPGTAPVRALRGRKDARELELLRAASELTQRAIRAVSERLRPGLTDQELGRWITFAQERLGLRDTWVLPLLGPNAAYPHGEADGHTTLEAGTGVLVDTGGELFGYQSDITRSWSFGAPRETEFVRAWQAVHAAQAAAFERIAPGVPCREVDRAARAVIEAAGYPGGYAVFGHRLGHGIGLQGHEEPYFDGGSEVVLEPGMTFSDEPGIYLAGRLGVRLEDIVVVTPSGADVFGSWQSSHERP